MKHRETIVTPRADWMLLRMHYRRVLAPVATLCFVGMLTVIAVGHGVARIRGFDVDAMLPDGLDRLAIAVAALIALPVGAAVFSRPFKEQHVLLFHALPVSRLRQWALFATSSLLALLTVYAGLALLRPGAVSMLTRAGGLSIFAIVVAVSFAAGLCFSMVFVRAFAVYLSAYIATILAPLLICVSLFAPQMAYSRIRPDLSAGRFFIELVELPGEPSSSILWIGALLLTAAFVAASAWIYVRGEMTLPRVQLRNVLIIAGGTAVLVAFVAPLMYAWSPGPRTVGEHGVLPDGRRVVVRHQNSEAPWQSDLTIHDLASGGSVTFEVPGLRELGPASDRELAVWIRDSSPLRRLMYLRPPRDRIERWSFDGRRLGSEVYNGGILGWWTRPERGIVVVDEGEAARVYETRGGVKTRELFHAPVPDDLNISRDVVSFSWAGRDPRVWRIDAGGAHEIPRAPIASDTNGTWIFEGSFYPTRESVVRRIEEDWPVPRARNERVGYMFAGDVRWVWAVVANPSTLTATLYLAELPAKRWTRIGDGIPLSPNELPPEEPGFFGFNMGSSMIFGFATGNALFVERIDGRLRHRFHDASRDTTVTLLARAPDDQRRLSMRSSLLVTPPDTTTVAIQHDLKPVAEFLWRDGRLEPFPIRPGGDFVRALWPDGTQVRSDGIHITVTDPRGNSRRLALARQE